MFLHPVIREERRAERGLAITDGPHVRSSAVPQPPRSTKPSDWLAPYSRWCQSGLVPVTRPRPATLFGPGKVEELRGIIEAEAVGLVIVDHPLTAVQQRNLETAWNAKILDRTGLILEIFGARARTKEGRLQVELAHLLYQRSRLVRSWTHLERQRGGFGFLGGPGETQIELTVVSAIARAIRRDLGGAPHARTAPGQPPPHAVPHLGAGATPTRKSILSIADQGCSGCGDKLFQRSTHHAQHRLQSGGTASCPYCCLHIGTPTACRCFRATRKGVEAILLHAALSPPRTPRSKARRLICAAELVLDIDGHDNKLIEVWNKVDLLTARTRPCWPGLAEDRAPVLVSPGARRHGYLKNASRRAGRTHLIRC